MSIVFLLALLVGGVLLLGLGLMAMKGTHMNVGPMAQRLMALSTLLVPAVMILSACNSASV